MYNVIQIKNGLSNYIDNEMLPKMQDAGFKKIIFATGASLFLRKFEDTVSEYQSNTFLKMLNVFDENGNIDIDTVIDELCKQIPASGVAINIPLVGDIVLYTQDLNLVKQYISRA